MEIKLLDVMGSDEAIVQAARVSVGQGTKTPAADEKLIRYLMRHRHTSPFEMVEFKFYIKAPIFIARQLMRHRMASINEISGRYTEFPDENLFIPKEDTFLKQAIDNKQGASTEIVEEPFAVQDHYQRCCESSMKGYKYLLSTGLRRELARAVLPLATETEFIWKIDLHNLLHFLRLRLDGHAQLEIRQLAQQLAAVVQEKVPVTWKAFEDYVLNAVTLSAQDLDCLQIEIDSVKAVEKLGVRGTQELINKLKGDRK